MTDLEQATLDDLKSMLETLQKQHQETEGKRFAVKLEVAQIESDLQKKMREERDLVAQLQTEAQTAREIEKRIQSAMRLELVREEQESLRERFMAKAAELDKLTASAKWREFALDHQISGAKILGVAKRGILADKRGLGKTLTSLIWADMVGAKKIIVIAPNDVVPQFEDEIRTWAPARTVMGLRGMPKGQRDIALSMLAHLDEYIITINYEAWRRDKTIIDDLVRAGLDTIICDEAHRIKAADKITARGVHQLAYRPNLCDSCGVVEIDSWWNKQKAALIDFYGANCPKCGARLRSTVANVLAMTGTPILNKPQELFSILYLVNRKLFPRKVDFETDFCVQYAPNRWKFRPGGLSRLTGMIKEFFVQRTREDAGIILPPPAITVHEIIKDKVKYKKQYDAERDLTEKASLMLDREDARKDFFYLFEIMLRERQMMTWPAGIHLILKNDLGEIIDELDFDVEESQKLDEIEELLNDLTEEEERVVVFSQFKAPLYELQRRLVAKGVSVGMATGDQNEQQKAAVRNDFDLKTAPPNPRYQVCLATYKAFGTGINLNAARHMVIVDDEWNPGMEDQAIGRIDRMNNEDQANVHIFRVKDSVDDFMAALLDEKREVVDDYETSAATESLFNFFKDRWNM